VQPVRDPVGAVHSALRRALISRGVFQPTALPTSEMAAKYPKTTTPTRQTHKPLPATAEPGRGVAEGHGLIDADPLAVGTRAESARSG
jgi:hypothetical protein